MPCARTVKKLGSFHDLGIIEVLNIDKPLGPYKGPEDNEEKR